MLIEASVFGVGRAPLDPNLAEPEGGVILRSGTGFSGAEINLVKGHSPSVARSCNRSETAQGSIVLLSDILDTQVPTALIHVSAGGGFFLTFAGPNSRFLATLGCFANFGTFQITGRRHERPGRKKMVLLNRMVIHYHHEFIWALRSYLIPPSKPQRGPIRAP